MTAETFKRNIALIEDQHLLLPKMKSDVHHLQDSLIDNDGRKANDAMAADSASFYSNNFS